MNENMDTQMHMPAVTNACACVYIGGFKDFFLSQENYVLYWNNQTFMLGHCMKQHLRVAVYRVGIAPLKHSESLTNLLACLWCQEFQGKHQSMLYSQLSWGKIPIWHFPKYSSIIDWLVVWNMAAYAALESVFSHLRKLGFFCNSCKCVIIFWVFLKAWCSCAPSKKSIPIVQKIFVSWVLSLCCLIKQLLSLRMITRKTGIIVQILSLILQFFMWEVWMVQS